MNTQTRSDAGEQLDVRVIPPPQKHPTILSRYHALQPGQSFTLVNDPDPKPRYYQFNAEHPGQLEWEYLERGPAVWRVRIGKPRS